MNKTCKTCKTEWLESDFTANGKRPDGTPRLRPSCKMCSAASRAIAYQARRAEPYCTTCVEKTCTKCHVTKPADQFAKCLLTRDRCQSWCKACGNIRALAAYHARKLKPSL
jgi:hypothetical protein